MKTALPRSDYKKIVTKQLLPKISYQDVVTTKTVKTVITIFNDYQKMVRTISNGHI